MLSQLGLDTEDIREWKKHSVFEELEAEASNPTPVQSKPSKKKQ